MTMTGLGKLRADITALLDRTRNLGPAYLRAATVVLAAAQYRIRSKNGGTWQPEAIPNSQGTLLNRTGVLMRSLTVGGSGNIYRDTSNGVRVGTNLRTPDGQYSIGELMQYGTRPIKPTGKFLVFEVNGQKIFSKGTKGIPARPFLFIDEKTATRTRDVFAAYILRGSDGNSQS